MTTSPDAVVVGSGPNGLAAAVTLAAEGLSVRVYEAAPTPGGGCRTAELTLPGFVHDVCSAVHPLALASPFLRRLDLRSRGVRLLQPKIALAHPLDGGRAAALTGTVGQTAALLGSDGPAYSDLMGPPVSHWEAIVSELLSSLRRPPRHPVILGRFGLLGLRSAQGLAGARFRGEPARALFGGIAAHAMLPLTAPATSAYGLLMGMLGHAVGWPVVEGGSDRIIAALVAALVELGGEVVVDQPIGSLSELPPARATLLDVTPRQFTAMAGDRLQPSYRRRLGRFRYGAGAFKVDWALSGPVPWEAPECHRTATVHVGGTLPELVASEAAVAAGRHPERPYAIVVQPGVVDPTRAPAGQQTLWAYCHVPNGSTVDMTARIEAQIERFAPGFRDLVVGRAVRGPAVLEAENANYVGGDINGGVQDLRQTLMRPTARWNPYGTPLDGVYLCSSSTPPGGGVHGMCGHLAARSALHEVFGRRGAAQSSTADSVPAAPP
ncbi:MAG: NAD(P)/FAD-dependent oxidoreductase [Pseudonocardiales bacterium]